MRLTWKDVVTTVCAAAIVAVYAAYLQGTEVAFISGVRWVAGTVLVLGMVGGCGLSAADVYEQPRSTVRRAYLVVATSLGVTALVAGVIALITASGTALAVLVAATVALWLIATVRHAWPRATRPVTRDTHETIGMREADRH
jgi:hypothetical protein